MVTSLSLPPYNFFLVNFITFTLFFLFLVKKSNQHKNIKLFFTYGWFFGFGYFATNLYWISISLTFDQNFTFLIPLTTILIPAFISIFYGLVSCFFTWRMVYGAQDMYKYSEETMLLQFPIWIPFIPVIFSFGLLSLCCLYTFFKEYNNFSAKV